jgi:hypothetical protein
LILEEGKTFNDKSKNMLWQYHSSKLLYNLKVKGKKWRVRVFI